MHIQALRAFRRAEIIFDVVLCESCGGGVVGATAVAWILLLVFSFLWGAVLSSFWKPLGGLAAIWGPILATHLLEICIDSGF